MTSMTDAPGGDDGRVAREAARVAACELYESQLRTAADALVSAIRGGVTDGAEAISHLLATVAANLGGMRILTAARPGSWEADYVDRFLASTVGPDGEWLLQYRTAPIEVVECVEDAMGDLGIDLLYDDSYALVHHAEAAAVSDGGVWSAAAWDRVAGAEELIEQLRGRDYAAYRGAFEARVQAAAEELRRARYLSESVPVRVRWVDWSERDQTTRAQQSWGSVESELWETARLSTPPPGFSEPLADIPGPRLPGEILRETGRMPHQRIPELAHYAAVSGDHTNRQGDTDPAADSTEDTGTDAAAGGEGR